MRVAASIAAVSMLAAALTALVGCAQEERPMPPTATADSEGAHDASVQSAPVGPRECTQARAQGLPQRLVTMSADAGSAPQVVLASDLFDRFNQVCAPCHTAASDPPGQGGFQIVQGTAFSTSMTASVIQHVTNAVCPGSGPSPNDPNDPMPPCDSNEGRTYTTRPDSDPVKQFASLVTAWLAAGSPPSFTPAATASAASADGGPPPQFTMTPALADALTNVGNCIPSPALVGIETERSAALDAMFASAKPNPNGTAQEVIGLPQLLSQTDLFTLDSAALAPYGVIAYAPAYPLWTDDAGKLRYVRVPRGKSIRFDKTTQQFVIPENTRFYKTFMKQIVDTDGSYRYRKIETRLIVSRPDTNNADGTAASQNALFGSYQWNADETDASLVENPLHDGKPFSDTLFLYDTDEPLAADVLASGPASPELQLLNYQAARHYAIPSSARCIQCHMGSGSQSFVLGFAPLQINRRPVGVGGVIEAAGPDELTQLQRLIDAGVITGIDSPGDVLPLEQSQGTRTPRNDYELEAQGYMLGNCSHCHNPRGYPSVQNASLKNLLSFLPAAGPLGGIFQFPLEVYSPRIFRGPSGSELIPYITPSLVDLPRTDPYSGLQAADPFVSQPSPGGTVEWIDYAPWRSIIYRNADSPFAYVDDVAIFPHMPMNGVSYDPRLKQLLGDWMVSIPAIRKRPDIPEYAYQVDSVAADNLGGPVVDTSFQPYVEVLPGDPAYAQAVSDANDRLAILHSGSNPLIPSAVTYSRYADPGDTDDILDPLVVQNPVCQPVPVANPNRYDNPLPEHPHWVNTDLTSPPGIWAPRQPNWPDVLVGQDLPTAAAVQGQCGASAPLLAALDDQIKAIELLPHATLSQIQPYATTPVPFGLWQSQPGCDLSTQPTVQSFAGASRPNWMTFLPASDTNAAVYSQTPGEAIFKTICINCHGPTGNANGRLAQNLATMTGGNALVADFPDGLFGPVGSTESTSYRAQVFGALPSGASAQWTGATIDDRAARYMAWMGLGGTSVNIPLEILQIVAVTKVLDQQRVLSSSSLSANMLSQAKSLCRSILWPTSEAELYFGAGHGYLDSNLTIARTLNDNIIWKNGDAEMWLRLCSLANAPPIRVFTMTKDAQAAHITGAVDGQGNFAIVQGNLVSASVYPPSVPVGNALGETDASLLATNVWPWCVDDSTAPADQKAAIAAHVPVCPPAVAAASETCPPGTGDCLSTDDANRWAVRGAINAGMSVFLYVESIENSAPPPDYNQCNLLP